MSFLLSRRAIAAAPSFRLTVPASATLGAVIAATLLAGSAGCGGRNNQFATVNGQTISHDDYMRALERAPVTIGTPAPGQAPQQVPAGRFVLDQLVGNKVVMAEATKAGVAPTEDEVNKRYDLQKRLMQVQMPDKNFDTEMKNQGRTEADVKDELRTQLAETNLLVKRLGVTEDQLKKAYDLQKSSLSFPERAQLRLIVVPAGGQAAKLVQQQIAKKTDFAEIAKQNNLPQYQAIGGLLPQAVPVASLPLQWQSKIKSASDGGVFGPVDAPGPSAPGQPRMSTWVRVEKKMPAYQLTYEEAKPLLRQALVRQQMTDPKNKSIRDSIVTQKMQADVNLSDDLHKGVWQAVKDQAKASGLGQDAAASAGAVVPQAPSAPALPAAR